jgi:hypothetical protein
VHAFNPSRSLSAPTNNNPLQEQMREDYATQLMSAQRQLLQQNQSGIGRQELEIGSMATRRVGTNVSSDCREGQPTEIAQRSVGWNRLPAGVALRYIGVIACWIGAIVPGLTGVRLAVVVVTVVVIVAVVRVIVRPPQPGAGPPPAVASVVPAMVPVATIHVPKTIVQAGEAPVEAAAVKSTTVEPAKPTGMEPAAVEPAKAPAMEPAAAMEPPAATMPSVSDLGLTDRGGE